MAPKDRPDRMQLCAWFNFAQLGEIDRRVAELQAQTPQKIHRSDVLKEIVDEWIQRRKPTP